MLRFLSFSSAALVAMILAGTTVGRGDEPPAPKDDALDRLLEKLEKPAPPPPPAAKPETEPAKPEPAKPGAEAPAQQPPAGGEKKSAGEVAPKDQALDSLLEKLGETKDKPATEEERKKGPSLPGQEPKEPGAPKPDKGEASDLTEKNKGLDEHLEKITGRDRKKKQEQDGEGSGPLSNVIKEMREVEKRLGQPDTGEETRKKQTEIVKNLDQLIEQLRNSSSQSKGQKMRMAMQQGQQPGQQSGQQQPGANAGGAPNTKPAKPDGKRSTLDGKEVWGHLPEELRQEMDNVTREAMLPSREDLIRLYYLSVSKKSLSRGER